MKLVHRKEKKRQTIFFMPHKTIYSHHLYYLTIKMALIKKNKTENFNQIYNHSKLKVQQFALYETRNTRRRKKS